MTNIAKLHSALSRVLCCKDWAFQANLVNVGGELEKAANDIKAVLMDDNIKEKKENPHDKK